MPTEFSKLSYNERTYYQVTQSDSTSHLRHYVKKDTPVSTPVLIEKSIQSPGTSLFAPKLNSPSKIQTVIPQPVRRSSRVKKHTTFFVPGAHFSNLFAAINAPLPVDQPSSSFLNNSKFHTAPIDHTIFAAKKKSDPDTLPYNEAMNDINWDEWLKAAEKRNTRFRNAWDLERSLKI